jgi:mannose/fructose/N-acetylgalactosamine-specific phosphotransferase system component IIC
MRKRTPEFIRRTIRDTTLCVVLGVSLGAFFCLVALGIFLFGGTRAFEANHVSVISVLGIYLLAGSLGGLVVGLALPLTKWMLGAALVAFVAAFVVWFCVGWSISSQKPLLSIVHTSAVLGAAFGLPIGVGFWIQDRLDKRAGRW